MCLVGMLLFAATGITLNHAAHIEAKPRVVEKQGVLPPALCAQLKESDALLPKAISDWVADSLSVRIDSRPAEWSDDEIYVGLPRPGGDAWLTIDRESGAVTYERTDRGWVSYFNDLHKGRNTGVAWVWFLDAFAISCIVFCITGFFLLQFHSRARPATWPMVALGVVIPLVLAILFIH